MSFTVCSLHHNSGVRGTWRKSTLVGCLWFFSWLFLKQPSSPSRAGAWRCHFKHSQFIPAKDHFVGHEIPQALGFGFYKLFCRNVFSCTGEKGAWWAEWSKSQRAGAAPCSQQGSKSILPLPERGFSNQGSPQSLSAGPGLLQRECKDCFKPRVVGAQGK